LQDLPSGGSDPFLLWLACYTQEEIAELLDCSVQPIKDVISDFSEGLPKNLKVAADHLVDFQSLTGESFAR